MSFGGNSSRTNFGENAKSPCFWQAARYFAWLPNFSCRNSETEAVPTLIFSAKALTWIGSKLRHPPFSYWWCSLRPAMILRRASPFSVLHYVFCYPWAPSPPEAWICASAPINAFLRRQAAPCPLSSDGGWSAHPNSFISSGHTCLASSLRSQSPTVISPDRPSPQSTYQGPRPPHPDRSRPRTNKASRPTSWPASAVKWPPSDGLSCC